MYASIFSHALRTSWFTAASMPADPAAGSSSTSATGLSAMNFSTVDDTLSSVAALWSLR